MKIRFSHVPLLALACAGLLASCKSQATFDKADTNKDGKVNLPELQKFAVSRLFVWFDADKDGFVSLQEWLPAQPTAKDRQKFKERDLNSDGRVSLEEALTVAKGRDSYVEMLEIIDANGDGVIDRTEADIYLKRYRSNKP